MDGIRHNNHYRAPTRPIDYYPPIIGLYDEISAIYASAGPDLSIAQDLLQPRRIIIGNGHAEISNIAKDILQVAPFSDEAELLEPPEISSPNLPLEIWEEITSYLDDEKDAMAFSYTNKTLHGVVLSYKKLQLRQQLLDRACAIYACVWNERNWWNRHLVAKNKVCPTWALMHNYLKDLLIGRDLSSLIDLEQATCISRLYDTVRTADEILAIKLDDTRLTDYGKSVWAIAAKKTFSSSSRLASGFINIMYQNDKASMIKMMSDCIRAVAAYLQTCKCVDSPNPFSNVFASTWLDTYNASTLEDLDAHYTAILTQYKIGMQHLNTSMDRHTRKASCALSLRVEAELGDSKYLTSWPRIIAVTMPVDKVAFELATIAYRACWERERKNAPVCRSEFLKWMIYAGELNRARKYIDETYLSSEKLVEEAILTKENGKIKINLT